MMENTSQFVAQDGVKLFLRKWKSVEPPRAVLLIVHGMAEHSGRYDATARFLAERHIEVWAPDHRGHGLTADLSLNDAALGGLLGHCADNDAFSKIIGDIDGIAAEIQKTYPALPLFLLGHSWGSFIAQGYIQSCQRSIAGCILSGTRGEGGLDVSLGAPFLTVFGALRGVRARSSILMRLADGAYNKFFRPNRTPFDWGSRDEKEVDAFIADPLCGKLASIGFYRDLARCLVRINNPKNTEKIRRDLPIYIFSGSADPVGHLGKGPTALAKKYRALGIHDLEFVLYQGGRHEMLNETNRNEVLEHLFCWLDNHCAKNYAGAAGEI
jgi:alpha-beta hydrolase superfamily lysophospholipase